MYMYIYSEEKHYMYMHIYSEEKPRHIGFLIANTLTEHLLLASFTQQKYKRRFLRPRPPWYIYMYQGLSWLPFDLWNQLQKNWISSSPYKLLSDNLH